MVTTRSQARKERSESKRKDGEVDVGKVVYLPDRPFSLEKGEMWYGLVLQFNPVDKSIVLVLNGKLKMGQYCVDSLMVIGNKEKADKIRTQLIQFGRRYGVSYANE